MGGARPEGSIADTAHEVREAVTAVMNGSRPTLIKLNLRRVSFIDSVGISIVSIQAAEVGGAKLIVTEPSRFVHRQLWVTFWGCLVPEPRLTPMSQHRPTLASLTTSMATAAYGRHRPLPDNRGGSPPT